MVYARATGLVRIPDELDRLDAAPLLCAGITVFNALRNADAPPRALVAIQGIGGLGHLGVQFAKKLGYRTVAIARGLKRPNWQGLSVPTSTSTVRPPTPARRCKRWAAQR